MNAALLFLGCDIAHNMRYLFLIILALASHTSYSQSVNVAAYGQAAFPATNYSLSGGQRLLNTLPADITPANGFGFTLAANYRFSFGLELGFTGGFIQFAEQFHEEVILFFIQNSSTTSARAVPISFSASYFFLDGFVHPYIGVGTGFMFYESQIEASQITGGDAQLQLNDQHGFTISPRAGIQFDVTDYMAIDLSFTYTHALNSSSNVDVVLLLDENNVEFVPGTEVNNTDFYTLGLGLVFTILSKQ